MRKNETFVVFDFDELQRYSHDTIGLLCLTEWDRSVLLSVLRFASWPSRWVGNLDNISGYSYPSNLLRNTGRLDDLEEALTNVERLEAKIIMASCLDDLATAVTGQGDDIRAGLEAIGRSLLAIANRPCCGDGVTVNVAIRGLTEQGNMSYGTQEGIVQGDPEQEAPPEGFASWEEFFAKKCTAANALADGFVTSLRGLSILAIINTTGLGALIGGAIGGFIVLPAAAIPIIVAAMIGLGLSITVLGLIADYIETNRDDFVCGLYLSGSAMAAQDFISGVIDEALAALVVASALHPLIRTIAMVMASTDTLNQLFDGSMQATYPDADCSGCEETPGDLVFSVSDNGTGFSYEYQGDGVYWIFVTTEAWGQAFHRGGWRIVTGGAKVTVTSVTVLSGQWDAYNGTFGFYYDGTNYFNQQSTAGFLASDVEEQMYYDADGDTSYKIVVEAQ